MKTWKISLAALALAPSWSCANLCGDVSSPMAKENLELQRSRLGVGENTRFDVLMAEKSYLELRYCEEPNDLEVFHLLAINVNQRVATAQAQVGLGFAVEIEADWVKAERNALGQYCEKLKKDIEARLKVGVVTRGDVALVGETCKSLK